MYYSRVGLLTDYLGSAQDNSEHIYKSDKLVPDDVRYQALLSKAAYSLPTNHKVNDSSTSGTRFMEQLIFIL